MVAERKMQPSPPPAEHRRRAVRYVVFLALSLLAFSCWALVSSRIDSVVLAATAGGGSGAAPMLTAEHDDDGIIATSNHAEMPASSGNATSRAAVEVGSPAMTTRQPPSGERTTTTTCDAESALLRVYLYDLPPEFHFGMLGWDGKAAGTAWPDVGDPRAVPRYPGGLNLQHSVEYWLTLDILSSTSTTSSSGDHRRPCTAVRVTNASLADVFLVPFFASLSYNRQSKPHGHGSGRNRHLQGELVRYLARQEEWRRWGGANHLVVPHHPNSMMDARRRLSAAMFVLSDFGRYPPDVANLRKDVIAPYKHVVPSLGDGDSPGFEQRPVLAYFQGAIHRKDGGRVRQRLYQLIKDEKDVHFTYGSVRQNGIRRATKGMASSKFCLNIAGDTPSSNRLFDAIVSHCIPVIISDDIELPFEDVLDYSEFCVFVRASDSVKRGFLLHLLRGISQEEWTAMWNRLKEVAHHFEYQYPSQPGDAVQMIWGAVARKMHSVKLQLHKRGRYQRTLSESVS